MFRKAATMRKTMTGIGGDKEGKKAQKETDLMQLIKKELDLGRLSSELESINQLKMTNKTMSSLLVHE